MSFERVVKLRDYETDRFLKLYRAERVLYDMNLEDYKNRDLRMAAAERISKELNIPGFGPREIMYKFKNLRSSYCQELKKIAEAERLGMVHTPKVFWFDLMHSFIRPFVNSRAAQACASLSCPNEDSNDERSRSPIQPPGPSEDSTEVPSSPSGSIVKTETSLSPIKRRRSFVSSPEVPEKSRKKQQDPLVLPLEDTNGVPQNMQNGVQLLREEDIYDNFGRYVASMLRSMGPPTSLRLQAKITSTLVNTMCLLQSSQSNSMHSGVGAESD
ncbi:uncharacterized protein LOC123682057 [Harmonia axyridis]|uniref:uncharacterized protein LOC123682057 n=1 Tax=Harmonia axyridis TaxID=115357 RepID=UPI001E2781DF|nr:uncharacterized protein LOC123682057 [Harmonia axyridis]